MNKTDIFDNINNLYSEYQFLYEKKLDNYEQYYIAFETEKNNLFHAILKLYCKSDNSDNWDFIDIITETIDSALEKFPEYLKKNQDKKQNELTFSQYVCVKINNCLSKAKSIQIAENNTGGSKITEHEARMIRAIKKDFENLMNFNLTEEDLIEEISLRQGIGKKTVRKYLPLIRNNTKSINDIFLEVTSNSITPEKINYLLVRYKLAILSFYRKFLKQWKDNITKTIKWKVRFLRYICLKILRTTKSLLLKMI